MKSEYRRRLFRELRRLLPLAVCGMACGISSGQSEMPLGVVAAAPQGTRAVAVDGLFMVPYRETVPGSDVSFEMVPIPGGEFMLGSPDGEPGRGDDEGPQVKIRVPPFWMARCEVTWEQYRPFMGLYPIFKRFAAKGIRIVDEASRGRAITAPTPLYDPTFTFALGEEPRHPAVTMSHYAARQFTKWLSATTGRVYRLPCEAEWEHACRAGTTTAYSCGDDPATLEKYAWYAENADDSYHRVGEKEANPWGLYDMHGNVGEMVLDQYDSTTYARLAGGGLTPDAEDVIQWPTSIFSRVIRGGSWNDDPEQLRSASRSQTEDWRTEDPNIPKSPWWLTDEQAQMVGFRVIRPWTAPTAEESAKFWDIDNEDQRLDIQFRISEGRGIEGLVDPELPAAIKAGAGK